MKDINIDYSRFVLKPAYFAQKSWLHGINHTFRVMTHILYLGHLLENTRETRLALFAAYIHDMQREHDGYCTEHGQWAVKNTLPDYADFFIEQGAAKEELEEIGAAVKNHSERHEITEDHPYYITAAMLKDADALDRIRLGKDNLNVNFLRFEQTHHLINFAQELFYMSENKTFRAFPEMLKIAEKIKRSLLC